MCNLVELGDIGFMDETDGLCIMLPNLLWIYMAVDMNAWMRSMSVLSYSYFIGACSYFPRILVVEGSSCCVTVSVED